MPKSGNELIPYVQDGSTLYNIHFSKEDKILNKLKNFFQYLNEFSEESDVEKVLDYQQKRLDRKKRIKMMREKLINIENELKNFVELDSKLSLGKRIYKGIIDLCKKYPKTTIVISVLTPLMMYKISKVLLGSKISKIKDKNKLSLFNNYYKLFKKK